MLELEIIGAAREVTGSCSLLRVGGGRVLVDCGLIQGRLQDVARNREPFPFDSRTLDAVILTHAHLDHSGRLPLLLAAGFRGPIYAHPATVELCALLLEDAAYIHEKDAEWENRKRERKGLTPVQPLFTRDQAEQVLTQMRPLPFDELHKVLPGLQVRLRDAGHILGSAIVEAWLEWGGTRRKLVFSGDLGRPGAPILRDPTPVEEADLVILESTYGDRLHRSWAATQAELRELMTIAQDRRGNILIPAFAVGRTQEILYAFHRHFQEWGLGNWRIFLDSPLAQRATEVYARHLRLYDAEARALARGGGLFRLPNLTATETPEASQAINRIRSGAIIIAGSGMCDGGRIKQHLKHNVWRRDCHVVIVGFQAQGTLGRQLVDGARYIRLWGETIKVNAQVHTIGGLSAHADQAELLAWYDHFRERPPLALVHGELAAMEALAQKLRSTFATRVTLPSPGQRIDLHRLE
ncbi:MAG TPA: MBL fold metallo-hydrolase [Candidatus Competibacteraceae bacterium]|nr:MBL fold metallo-hydrolase [Candidatus Competibacteraceae bacterium]